MDIQKITLWSWLTKSETKKEFHCPPGLEVTNAELADALSNQVKSNRLPAIIELCEVDWDDTNTKQTRVLARYTGGGASTDIVRFLVGVDQMGNFAYVEEKVYILPPILPEKPRPVKTVEDLPGSVIAFALVGIFIAIGWIESAPGVAIVSGVVGIGAAIVAYVTLTSNFEAKRSNQEAAKERTAWDAVWNSWHKETLEAAYLSKTDDVFGRFVLAMSSTVEQVLKMLFLDKEAELHRQTESNQTQAEIEKELERRKEDLFA